MQVESRHGPTSAAAPGASAAYSGAARYATMLQSLQHIAQAEGVVGLWRGALARTVFTAPNTAITMVVYEHAKGLVA